jgi:transcriptional regulator GlxA family with amidase domain
MPKAVSMRTLYFRPGLVSGLPPSCGVLHVSPLLRELIVETVRIGQLRKTNRVESALCDLVVSQLESASPVPTFLTLPSEPRALAVAKAMLRNPAQSRTLAELCDEVGVSVRTIERLFRKDVGIDFESWRRQARLMKSVELLIAGCPVKEVAFRVGYRQGSAFVEAFRRSFGVAPKAWILALEKLDG